MKIDTYPVGLLEDLRQIWRAQVTRRGLVPPIARKHAWRNLRNCVKVHVWKNTFNGYLAEPTPWPESVTRCGSGWTRQRALRSLRRNVRRPGVRWEEVDREIVKAMDGAS